MTDRLTEDADHADWYAEVAGRAYLDGHYSDALQAADRAVKLTQRVLRQISDDQRVINVLAERHRWRAFIHEELGNRTKAIKDAEAAITLYGRLEDPPPLAIPLLRLLQCELYAARGDVAAARETGRAVEAYRQQAHEDDTEPLTIAEGLGRYASGMALIGDVEAARAARREAVDFYRAGLKPSFGARHRLRFVQILQELVADAGPPSAAAAPEVLPMLQDAAEQRVFLIPPSLFAFADPKERDHGLAVCQILEAQSRWLDALGAPRTAAVFAQASQLILQVPVPRWMDELHFLREGLELAVAAGADPA
ncbi:hypothetical protein [Streptomyces sp. UG1]|uniref:hypothetical protein n=1 Tax=Streptomyces sp. UG1 TaxID=3417652 RepID=UPI003CFA426A